MYIQLESGPGSHCKQPRDQRKVESRATASLPELNEGRSSQSFSRPQLGFRLCTKDGSEDLRKAPKRS